MNRKVEKQIKSLAKNLSPLKFSEKVNLLQTLFGEEFIEALVFVQNTRKSLTK